MLRIVFRKTLGSILMLLWRCLQSRCCWWSRGWPAAARIDSGSVTTGSDHRAVYHGAGRGHFRCAGRRTQPGKQPVWWRCVPLARSWRCCCWVSLSSPQTIDLSGAGLCGDGDILGAFLHAGMHTTKSPLLGMIVLFLPPLPDAVPAPDCQESAHCGGRRYIMWAWWSSSPA